MKPLKGKRLELAVRLGQSILGVLDCVCVERKPMCVQLPMRLVCTCLGCGSTSVFCARDGGAEGGFFREALQPHFHVARGTEGVAARRKAGAPCSLLLSGVPLRAVVCLSVGEQCGTTNVLRMLTKWLQTTRLETRTKESNICASLRVSNPGAE